jgi:hypothetical protein
MLRGLCDEFVKKVIRRQLGRLARLPELTLVSARELGQAFI